MYSFWWSSTFSPLQENEFFNDAFGPFVLGAICIFAYYCCCGLLLIEILLRKFVIPKIFPNLKNPFNIKISKKLNIILSVVFYILFALATYPLILLILAIILDFIES